MHEIDVRHADFRRLDLNLLVALDALLQTRHVGQAAQRLYIGQPAMSHALGRLRAHFGDELLVRSGRRMEPTALALELWPRLRSCLGMAAELLGPRDFDPWLAQASFRVALPEGLERLWLPRLLAHLRQHAPGIRPHVHMVEVNQTLAALDDDSIDLAIVAAPLSMRSWHHRQALLNSPFGYAYAPKHLQLTANAGLHELADLDHVVSSHRGEMPSVVDARFAALGLQRRVAASLSSLAAVRDALRVAPLVCILPTLYMESVRASDIQIRALQIEPVLAVDVEMVWHERSHGQPLQQYLRQVLRDVAS